MKTLSANSSSDARERAIQAMVDTPMNSASLKMAMEKTKKILLEGDNLVRDRYPLKADDLFDEDGNNYESVEFQILSVSDANGERWVSGIEYQINLTEYFRLVDEITTAALSKKVDRPGDLDFTEILGSL